MKITSLVENTSCKGLPVEHGLSLHIGLDDGRQILFDMGQGNLFADNAARLSIDLSAIDVAIISHGHYDHGGGLEVFFEKNAHAKAFVNRHAFEPHYSLRNNGLTYIGLDPRLKNNARLVSCGSEMRMGDMVLFSEVTGDCLYPAGNRLLFGPEKDRNDDFRHEQNMVITEGNKTVLFAGCAHAGIANIMQKAKEITHSSITHVFAGMHLVKSGLHEDDEAAFIGSLADELLKYRDCRYYTMHCTGQPQYELLKMRMGDAISYMSCGDEVKI